MKLLHTDAEHPDREFIELYVFGVYEALSILLALLIITLLVVQRCGHGGIPIWIWTVTP